MALQGPQKFVFKVLVLICFHQTLVGHHPTITWVLQTGRVLVVSEDLTRVRALTGETTSKDGMARKTLMEDRTSMHEERMAGDQDPVQDSTGEVTEASEKIGALMSASVGGISEDGGRTGETFRFAVGEFFWSLL